VKGYNVQTIHLQNTIHVLTIRLEKLSTLLHWYCHLCKKHWSHECPKSFKPIYLRFFAEPVDGGCSSASDVRRFRWSSSCCI